MKLNQRITPFLSFPSCAEEASEFYVSLIPNSGIIRKVANPMNDAVLTVEFELDGLRLIALNTGQDWKFTDAFSLSVACATQEEIDRLWETILQRGGKELACGWIRDHFGLSWQIVPSEIDEWLASGQSENIQRMFNALWQMVKLDIPTLQKAFHGED